MDTRRSYYLAQRQDDFAEAPADARTLNPTKSCMPLRPMTIRQPKLDCRRAAGTCFAALLPYMARQAERSSLAHLRKLFITLARPSASPRNMWLSLTRPN